VVTPVFDINNKEIIFFLASRGHHTDIGGLGGTSMPPNSTELWQEGAAIRTFTMIRNGKFDEAETVRIFAEPAGRPGCNAAQKVSDNITDLQAMAAANNKGVTLLKNLIEQYSQPVVHFYMNAIQSNAEVAVRKFLTSCKQKFGTNTLSAIGYMDNSSRIHLNVTLKEDGSAVFDFTGTTPELYGNMNAPMAITYSGIIYCLRAMIGTSIPLNQGCLAPISIIIPKGSFLNPSGGAAVCAGNTHTSQRVCDTILLAFRAAAASQGCMNCVGFFGGESIGKDGNTTGFKFSFGETICGGAGAGPGWKGASAVHTHMTNTRITDAELMEKRYPVLMREFSIRRGSGGKGMFDGGDGCTRIYEALAPLSFSVITERRTTSPFGLEGGMDGERGSNTWVRRMEDGTTRKINLGQRNMVRMGKGDQLVMVTPSGGGYGVPGMNGEVGQENFTNGAPHKRAMGSVTNWESSQADF
jgi:5-oxoprolinase (ATP-hydrolysing)